MSLPSARYERLTGRHGKGCSMSEPARPAPEFAALRARMRVHTRADCFFGGGTHCARSTEYRESADRFPARAAKATGHCAAEFKKIVVEALAHARERR